MPFTPVEKATNFRPNFSRTLGTDITWLLLDKAETTLNTPSALFEIDENLDDVKNPKKLIIVDDPSDFLLENPDYFSKDAYIGIAPCYHCEQYINDKRQFNNELKKFADKLQPYTHQ